MEGTFFVVILFTKPYLNNLATVAGIGVCVDEQFVLPALVGTKCARGMMGTSAKRAPILVPELCGAWACLGIHMLHNFQEPVEPEPRAKLMSMRKHTKQKTRRMCSI